MKSRALKAAIIAAEVVGAIVAAGVAIAAFVLWRAQSSPVSLNFLVPTVEFLASQRVEGAKVDLGDIQLVNDPAPGVYAIIAAEIRVSGAGSTVVLPRADFTFAARDLFDGEFGPRTITFRGASVRIVRRADKNLALDFGEASGDRAQGVFSTLTGGSIFRGAFRQAHLIDADIRFHDEATGRGWTGRNAEATIRRTKSGYTSAVSGLFEIDGKPASLTMNADFDVASDMIEATLELVDAPLGDIMPFFFGPRAEILSAPVTGKAFVSITGKGDVRASRIEGAASGGELSFAGRRIPVRGLELATQFDPAAGEFRVDRLSIDSDAISGTVGGNVILTNDQSGGPAAISFRLFSEEISIASPSGGDQLGFSGLAVNGGYEIDSRRLSIERLAADFKGGALAASGVASFDLDGVGVRGDLTLDASLSKQELLDVWPANSAEAARSFVEERVQAGVFSNVSAAVSIESGAHNGDAGLPDEAIDLRFSARDAIVSFAPTMPPIRNLSGRGRLGGNSFEFVASAGASVANVQLTSGGVDIPQLRPKGAPATFRFEARGDAGDIFEVLDREPLNVLRQTPYKPANFAGPVTIKATVVRPNQREAAREDYQYSGTAEGEGLSIRDFYRDIAADNINAAVTLTTASMRVQGDALIAEAPVEFDWRQRFTGGDDRMSMTLSGVFDSSAADLFGLPTRQFMRGEAPFSLTLAGDLGRVREASLAARLDDTALLLEPLQWSKMRGDAASLDAVFEFSDDGAELSRLLFEAPGARVEGRAAFGADRSVLAADFPVVRFEGGAEFRFTASRESGALDMSLTGPYLNSASMLEIFVEGRESGGTDWSRILAGATAHLRLDRLDLRGDVRLSDVAVDFRHGDQRVETLDFVGRDDHGHPISASLKLTGEENGYRQNIVARTDDIGALLGGVFGFRSIAGGEGVLSVDLAPGGELLDVAPSANGVFEARKMKIVNAPLLARLFAAGSLTGLQELLGGGGIEIEQAFADFTIDDGVVRLDGARAAGESVGITGDGQFALGGGPLRLNGALAPAYQINSFLGKAPLIGDLFVNRDGEGLIALSYDIKGVATEPEITVNPLSALAPGLFRRMFEPGVEDAGGGATE